MPGKGYPAKRVASTVYEHGSVSKSNTSSKEGPDSYMPCRAGSSKPATGMTHPPKRAGKRKA